MATKRTGIGDLIKTDMASRSISQVNEKIPEEKPSTPSKFKAKVKQSVKIRLDEGDYALLQQIAEEQGSKASILIRQAVKKIIKDNVASLADAGR
jgi:hypothetical protein